MTQEILFTSAPQGLAPGSKGFCTVVSTDGMSQNLSERLEMLSGYRHAFTPGDRRAPVNWRHLRIRVSGQDYSVLSRIGDAGLDYSQRSNKLAHHIAFAPSELTAAGPAAILASPGLFIPSWDGNVKTVANGQAPGIPSGGPSICQHWQSLTGDAAWAAVLAHSATVARPKPISVIFPQNCDTLPLVVEALNLIPPAQRWNVTFSTYFTKAIAGSDILWRFVLDGTKQADLLRKSPHGRVIDLAGSLGAPPENSYSNAARTGTPGADYSDRFAATAAPQSQAGGRTPMKMRAEKPPAPQQSADQADGWYEDDYGAGDMAVPPMPPQLPRHRPWYQRTATIVIAGILVILLIAALLYVLFPPEQPASPIIVQPPVTEDPADAAPDDMVPDDSDVDSEPEATAISDATSNETTPAPTAPPDNEPQRSPSVSGNPFTAFDSARLPSGMIPFYLDDGSSQTRLPLPLDDPQRCQLKTRAADPEIDSSLKMAEDSSGSGRGSRRWTLSLASQGGGRDTAIGNLLVDGRELVFERIINPDDGRFHQFRYSLLTVRHGDDSAEFLLGAPEEGHASPVELVRTDTAIQCTAALPEFLSESMLETLRFEVSHPALPGLLAADLKAGDTFAVRIDQQGKLRIERPVLEEETDTRDADETLAELLVQISVVHEEPGNADTEAVPVCVLTITPSVYLRLLQKTNTATLGERILYGNEDLLPKVRRYDWDIESVTRRLSAEHDEGEIRRAVRREYNRHVEEESLKLDETQTDFWAAVVEGADEYYKARSASRRGSRAEFRSGLQEIVSVVSGYTKTLAVLRRLTDRFHEEQLQLRAYTVLDGHVIDVLQTGTNDERD